MTVTLSIAQAEFLCEAAALRCGASAQTARALARASVDAEAEGAASVGMAHFVDYLEAMRAGRIDPLAAPVVTRPAPALILSDAKGGAAHPGFDAAFDDLCAAADALGLAAFSQRNAFTCGALAYFTRRLAERGLVALAATNGPALLAASGSTRPVFCTNPLSFAAPVAGGAPLVIDQSSSQTAFVNIRRAAAAGEAIPEGWALDGAGNPTTDPHQAMKGALLAFGGARGANIALMLEVLAAGLSGANWSADAPDFVSGAACPATGLFVLALSPALLEPGFAERMAGYLARLSGDYGVYIPGCEKAARRERAALEGVTISAALHGRIAGF